MAWHCGSHNCPTHSSSEHQCGGWQMAQITTAVGGSIGYSFDKNVQIVQGTLNRFSGTLEVHKPRLATDGICGNKTLTAIGNFQRRLGFMHPDRRVDVNKRTHLALAADRARCRPIFSCTCSECSTYSAEQRKRVLVCFRSDAHSMETQPDAFDPSRES